MEARTISSELSLRRGRKVRVQGWVHRIRRFGGVQFLVLRDRGGLAQVVAPREVNLGEINSEWVVSVQGVCREEARAPMGVEVAAERVDVIAPAKAPPLEIFNPDALAKNRLETLLDHRAVSLRIPEALNVFRVQSVVLDAFRQHLWSQGFTEIVSPKLVRAGAEGGSAVFEVKYYDGTAYLAQSPQFYKQIMVGSGLERVFEVGHAYRAEKSETTRHMTEFLSLDFEMGFIESVQDVIRMHTGVIRAMFEAAREKCASILEQRKVSLPEVSEIPQISFPEAKQVLEQKFRKREGIEGDLDTEGERLICEWAEKELASELLFVTGYHEERRPMYTMPDEEHPPMTHSFDLLFRGVEVTTGGQRIHLYDRLVERMEQRGLTPSGYEGYLEVFRHGMPPHGGIGMGMERLLKQMLRLANVREASAFPRDRYRVEP